MVGGMGGFFGDFFGFGVWDGTYVDKGGVFGRVLCGGWL